MTNSDSFAFIPEPPIYGGFVQTTSYFCESILYIFIIMSNCHIFSPKVGIKSEKAVSISAGAVTVISEP